MRRLPHRKVTKSRVDLLSSLFVICSRFSFVVFGLLFSLRVASVQKCHFAI